MVAADDRTAVTFSLSPGQASDGVEGRALLENWQDKPEALPEKLPMAMDKAYEGDETRASVTQAGFSPVVPPKDNRKEPWEYDEELYNGATKSNDSSASLKASGASSRVSKSSTSCSELSSISRSHTSSCSVNRP